MTATYTQGEAGGVRDQVRRLIPDKTLDGLTPSGSVYTLTTFVFSDEELDDYLRDENQSAYAAAAAALEGAVSGGALTAEKVSGLGFSIDDTGGYSALTARARWLRGQANGGAVMGKSRSIIVTPVW